MAQQIPIDQLHPQQLMQLKKQLEEEMNLLGTSLQQFRVASNKYEDQKQILHQLQEPSNKGQPMLIPLTQSLFIEGTFDDSDKVLVDYGTGYYVQRNIQQASEFSERKIKLLKENADKVTDIVNQKKKQLEQITMVLQQKMAQHYQQQQQQQPQTAE